MALELLINEEDRASFVTNELELLQLTYSKAYSGLFLRAEIELLSKTQIQELNKAYRQIDEPTDVLSFPTLAGFADIQNIASSVPTLLGSIVICPEKAIIYEERLIDLAHHGLLHLLGFDHETDRVQWDREEKRLLSQAENLGLVLKGIPHDSI